MAGVAVVAGRHPAVPGEPGDAAFDLPAVSAKPLVGLHAAAGDAGGDAAAGEPRAQVGDVVAPVGVQLVRRRRRGPRRERTAGIARTKGLSACWSLVLAAETATARGRPVASVSTWSLLPGLPRSTGLGPVSSPPSSRARWPRRRSSGTSPGCRPRPTHRVRRGCSRRHSPALVQGVNRRCAIESPRVRYRGGLSRERLLGGGVSTVVVGLDLGGGGVAERGVQSGVVEPVDPDEGGQLEVVRAAPGPLPVHAFGLVEPVHGLGEGRCRRSLRRCRRRRSRRRRPAAGCSGSRCTAWVLGAGVGVVDQALDGVPGSAAVPQRHVQGVQR